MNEPTRRRKWCVSEEQQERGKAHLAVFNSCSKRKASVPDRWTRDDQSRESQTMIGLTWEKVKRLDHFRVSPPPLQQMDVLVNTGTGTILNPISNS